MSREDKLDEEKKTQRGRGRFDIRGGSAVEGIWSKYPREEKEGEEQKPRGPQVPACAHSIMQEGWRVLSYHGHDPCTW